MKAMNLKCIMGSVLVAGMLAALPACAGSGLVKITHSDTPCKCADKCECATVAKVQPSVKQAKPAEVQLAVMAKSPSQPAGRRAVYIRR
jgi:hypothetical protein